MALNVVLVLAVTYLCGTWVAGACLAVLILIWRAIPRTEGPPTLQLALTTQWTQVSLGVFYVTLTGRELQATTSSNWVPMVLIGLGCVTALVIGIRLGLLAVARNTPKPQVAPEELVTLPTLVVIYMIGVIVTGIMQEVAFSYPTLTQAILALGMTRLALIYLLLRRFCNPLRWHLITALLAFEVALGFTGYFSDFKEPLLLAVLAFMERFNPRETSHWVASTALALVLAVACLMWMSVRGEYRQDFDDQAFAASRTARLERMEALSTDWFEQASDSSLMESADRLVDRVWAIYYPALAIARVPAVIPHTDGRLMMDTFVHLVTPRLLFPDKPDLPSDSDLVRQYSGARVAGIEENTSIAFGYAAESYVDFGLPWMFIPVFLFGLFIGATYEWFLRAIAHRELAIAFVTSTFWINLFMFERAWSKMIGFTLTMMVYVGLTAYLVDRWLLLQRDHADRLSRDIEHDPAYGTER